MRRSIIGLAVLAFIATSAYTVIAGDHCSKPCGTSANASASSTCSSSKSAAAACENDQGKIAGHFDPAMSGMCRFSCATKLEYQAKDVQAQPGARAGKLTQCPVSGVVFAVDARRPRVRIAGTNYVTCCDICAKKLKKDPRHYLKA
jgi:hypothetical protein